MKRQFVIWPALALTAIAASGTGPGSAKGRRDQHSGRPGKYQRRSEGRVRAGRQAGTKDQGSQKKQAEIRSLQESLNRGGNAMSEQAKAELVRNIDTRTKSFNRELEDAQAEWQQDQDRVLQDLGRR